MLLLCQGGWEWVWALPALHLPQPICAPRKHALRVLDLTGLLDDGVEQDPGTMSMWDCTAAVARTCIAQQQGGAVEPGLAPVPVEVRVDLRVNRASYAFLREALRSSVGSPLRLCCRDLRAEDLPMRNTVALLQLLDAGCLRRVDLRFNNLGLRGLSVIIPHVARFQHLASLRLHYVHGDSRQPSVDGEDNFRYFLAQMGRFTRLRELSMGSSLLSGRLDQLLRWAGPTAALPLSPDLPLALPVCDPISPAAPCRARWRAWSWPSALCCLRTCASWHAAPMLSTLRSWT